MYTIPEECPPRIVEDTNDYLPQDNLFAKARATDGDGLIISQDFTFEDIPEGLPLDDPLMFDHIENDNYRATTEIHEKPGRLEKPKDFKLKVENVHHSTVDNVEPEHTWTTGHADQPQTHSENVVLRETKPTETSVSKGKEKDNHYNKVIASSAVENIQTDKSAQNQKGESAVAENIPVRSESNEKIQPNIDYDVYYETAANNAADHHFNNDGKYEDKTGITDKTNTVHTDFNNTLIGNNTPKEDIQELQNHFTNFVGENIDSKIKTATENSSYLNTESEYFSVDTSLDSVKDDTHKNDIRPHVSTVHHYSNLPNVVAGKVNTDTFFDNNHYFYNIATEKGMPFVKTETDLHNSYDINGENKISELKEAAHQPVKDEFKYDTRNNIDQEIDSLNKAADHQLNKTQSRLVGSQIDYKLMYTHDEDDKVMTINSNNQNADNIIENYNVQDEPKENEMKRSQKYVTLKSESSQKIISDHDTHLESGNNKGVNNPKLADFHVIDTDKDLEVPEGVEGPIPVSVLPPPGFIPPAPQPSAVRSLHYKHRPSGAPAANVDEIISPPPPNFIPPPNPVQFRNRNLPTEPDFSHRASGEESAEPDMFDGLPPSINFPAPPPHDYWGVRDQYPGYRPQGFQKAFATISPPKHYVPASNLRSLQSVYTPNGQYFYFKTEDDGASRKFFIPAL